MTSDSENPESLPNPSSQPEAVAGVWTDRRLAILNRVSSDGGGGQSIRWAPGGDEVFHSSSGYLVAVPIQTEPEFEAGEEESLFRIGEASPDHLEANYHYDVAPDGEHFISRAVEDREPGRLHIVLNWFKELKRRVPTNR